mmetsp:Transcript_3845/g.7781  ORF Transcript_3845/g.7781 Transcript_3845/m.7781 type:complete len:353 (+) Transcript_3845:158-1216(+)
MLLVLVLLLIGRTVLGIRRRRLLAPSAGIRCRPYGLSPGPLSVVSKGSIRPNLLALAVHFAVGPIPDVPATVVPGHFSFSVKVSLAKGALVFGSVHKNALSSSVSHAVYPGSIVDGSVLVGHAALDHLATDVLALKDPSVGKPHDARSVLVIVFESSLVKVPVSVRQPAVSGPPAVYPISLVPAALFFVFEASLAVGHLGGLAEGARVDALFSVGIHDFSFLDQLDVGGGVGVGPVDDAEGFQLVPAQIDFLGDRALFVAIRFAAAPPSSPVVVVVVGVAVGVGGSVGVAAHRRFAVAHAGSGYHGSARHPRGRGSTPQGSVVVVKTNVVLVPAGIVVVVVVVVHEFDLPRE